MAVMAQDTVFRYRNPADSSRLDDVRHANLITCRGDGGYSCLVLRNLHLVQFILLDSNFSVRGQFSEGLMPTNNLFLLERAGRLGAVYNQERVTFYFTVKSPFMQEILYTKTIDFKDNSSLERPILNTDRVDSRIGFFMDADAQPYLLTLTPDKTQLRLERDGVQDAAIDITSMSDAPDLRFGFLHFVPDDRPQQLNNVAERTLAFVRGNQLLLLSRRNNQDLHLGIVDLAGAQAHFRDLSTRVGFATLDSGVSYSVGATVLEDKLFVLRSSPALAEVGVYQIPSLRLLKVIALTGANFPQKPRELATGGYIVNDVRDRPIDKPADFFYGLTRYPTGIAAEKDRRGGYLLTIGSFDDPDARYMSHGRPLYYEGTGDLSRLKATHRDDKLVEGGDVNVPRNSLDGAPAKKFPLNPGGLKFNATVLSLALDPATLDITAPADSADATMDMRNVLSSLDGGWKQVQHFVIHGTRYAGAFDRVTRTYSIWKN